MTDMELRITTGGIIANPLADVISAVSGAIGLYPGYTFQDAQIEWTPAGDVVHIFYTDNDTPQAEGITLIIYAILAAISILGIAYIIYEVFVVAPKSPFGQLTIIAGVITAIALLINSIRRKE